MTIDDTKLYELRETSGTDLAILGEAAATVVVRVNRVTIG